MAEDFGDKTEAPTPRRREEAREQGNVARSQDLSAAVLIITSMVLLNFYGTNLMRSMRSLMNDMLGGAAMRDLDARNAVFSFDRAIIMTGAALAPMLIGIMLAAIVVNVIQVGLNLNIKKLQPNLGALNPLKGFGRIFSAKGAGPAKIGLMVLKVAALGFAAYSAVHDRMGQIVAVQQLQFLPIFGLAAKMIYTVTIRIGIVMLIIAIIDYIHQKWRIEQELKMSKQEVKEEMRRMEGDPSIKLKRRQVAMHQLQQKLKKDVPTADVIVTNPTEIAIALKYDSGAMHAPRVVAKGQGFIAQRIREIAIASGIPILERKPLARALFKMCEVGQEIPEQFYATVAEILAYVYELTGKTKARVAV